MNEQNVKLMAMYLPQYHEIPENDEFWGKGFTDWVTVKNAKQFYSKIEQPRVPFNENYYDLSKIESIRWQVELAKENGISGFCFYHYWFSSEKNILQTPSELFLSDKSLDISFCFAWDNAPWKRTWSKAFGNDWSPLYDNNRNGPSELIHFEYGEKKDWLKHFNYLLPFFKDKRYEKKDNKPIFILWNYRETEKLIPMMNCWNDEAVKNGFSGIYFIGKYNKNIASTFDAEFYYQPLESGWANRTFARKVKEKLFKIITSNKLPLVYNYKSIWKRIISSATKEKRDNIFFGAFVNYDDSPRRGARGRCMKNVSPRIFKTYLKKLIQISALQNKEYIFLTAWNEWGEGAYLEPDNNMKKDFLNSIKEIKDELR